MKKKTIHLHKYIKFLLTCPRHYYVFGFFALSFVIILSKVFSYTIYNHEFYQKIADKQQIGEVTVPVTRGSILASNGEGTILATSVRLNDLAIDPTSVGDKTKLAEFLRDIVYRESCILKTEAECEDNILKFLKQIEIEGFVFNKENIDQKVGEFLLNKINQKKVKSVLLVQGIEEKTILEVALLGLPGVYASEGNIYINPEEILDETGTAAALSPFVSFPAESIKYAIRKREIRYISILSRLSIDESSWIGDFIKNERDAVSKGFIEEEDSIFKFLILTPNPHRYYPENKVASQVLGFVDNQGQGHYGIEGYFNDTLEGEAGEIVSRKDIRGRTIDPIDFDAKSDDREGAVIYTTIDRNIQNNVEQILEEGVKKYRANKGSVVVMDPKTGKIIAMANYPKFDSNTPGDVYELELVKNQDYVDPANELIGRGVLVADSVNGKEFYFDSKKILLRNIEREELSNYALKKYKYKNDFGAQVYRNAIISDLFEPGSIMKAITMAAGIDSGEITKDTMYQNSGPISIDQFKISDISNECYGYHSFAQALNYSCNVGMVRIIQKVGKALFFNYLKDFGFGNPTDVTLEGEVSLPIENYKNWSTAKLFTMSYGLGISINQLQMAVAYSALANGGLILRPQIVDKIDYKDGKVVDFSTEVVRRVISEETSDIMIDVLVDSIDNGVAITGKVEGYALAGKTGTSQIAYRGGYESGNVPGSTNGSFAGFGPAQDPKFVIIVTLNRPRTSNYGGSTSSHIFADIAKYLLDYYKIPKLENVE